MMLNVSSDTVLRLTELAREFHVQDSAMIETEPRLPDEAFFDELSGGHAADPVLAEFRSIVEDLEPDQQQEVVALLWLGRGDFTEEEFDEARALAAQQWTPRTADYLIGHPMLSDSLREGLEAFGLDCEH